jgi:glycogen operon protein
VDAFLRAERAGDGAALAALRDQGEVRSFAFARALLRFRGAHPALRPARFFTGTASPGSPLKDLAWYGAGGDELSAGWDDPALGYLGFRVAEGPGSIFVAYLWRDRPREVVLPANLAGARWRRVADTAAWMEPLGNVDPAPGAEIAGPYGLHERSAAIFVEG